MIIGKGSAAYTVTCTQNQIFFTYFQCRDDDTDCKGIAAYATRPITSKRLIEL